tara:strand:+ start:1621 stop:3813 length:2193 start_codon:yes stop_codon:yes gene_type:complete
MNIIDIQDQLKNFSEQQLISEMQAPTGSAPQFLVLSEIKRRKRVRDDFMKREAANQPTVAEEAVAAAGVPQSGIMGMSEAMAPKSTMVQNSVGSVMPQSMRPQIMPAPTDDAIPMRSGGLAQFGQELSQKLSSDTVEPFLDEVESMASDRFGIELGDGLMQSPFMGRIPPRGREGDYGGITSLFTRPVRRPTGLRGGKGGPRISSMDVPTSELGRFTLTRARAIPFAEGGVVKAANGLPLGLRQNNPGNIRPGAGFIGETGQGGGYAQFGSEEEGLRALARLLGTYSDEYGINTLRGLTSRYAPRSDNEASFDNYVSYLGEQLGMDPDEEFDLKSRRDELIPAIVGFEQGRDFGDRYSQGQISRAIEAAGTDDPEEVARILGGSDEPGIISKIASAINPISTAQAQGVGSSLTSPTMMFDDDVEGADPIRELRGGRKRRRDGEAVLTEDDRGEMSVADSFQVIQDAMDSGELPEPSGGEGVSAGRNVPRETTPEKVVLEEEDLADPVIMQFSELSPGQQRQYSKNRSVPGVDLVIDDREMSPIADFVMGAVGASDDEDTVEDPDAPPTTPEPEAQPERRGTDDGSTPQTGLAKEIADLRAKLEKDRETDKYLALAQAGLALMSSKEPTLLGAVGEAGISGLTAFREAQDRYQEGVVDLINAKAKMQGKTGSAFTTNQMIQRAKDLQDMATTANENGNLQRARELTMAANSLLAQAGLIETGGINEAFADQ